MSYALSFAYSVLYFLVVLDLAVSFIPVFCFALMASYFSFNSERKVTKRTPPTTSLPFGFPRHSPLPTGRPDSPSGLDMTKSDVPVGFSLPKPNTSANFTGGNPYNLMTAWMKHSVTREFPAALKSSGLQNTSMYSALRASNGCSLKLTGSHEHTV